MSYTSDFSQFVGQPIPPELRRIFSAMEQCLQRRGARPADIKRHEARMRFFLKKFVRFLEQRRSAAKRPVERRRSCLRRNVRVVKAKSSVVSLSSRFLSGNFALAEFILTKRRGLLPLTASALLSRGPPRSVLLTCVVFC